MIRGALQTALHAIYPPACIGCGAEVGADFALCGPCWRETPFVGGLVCDLCGVPLMGEDEGEAVHCDECMNVPRRWAHGRAALVYDGLGRTLAMRLKHGDRHDVARAAAPWLARAGRGIMAEDAVLVPVPLHRWRLAARRFNQSALLAHWLGRQTGKEVATRALTRAVATPPLQGKDREERFAALQGTIRAEPGAAAQVAGRQVVLIDDVMTSGATLTAAAEALAASRPRQIVVLTLARVAKEPYLQSK